MYFSFDFSGENIKPITLKKEIMCSGSSGTAYVSGYGPDWVRSFYNKYFAG
jgi:hypothetical protein